MGIFINVSRETKNAKHEKHLLSISLKCVIIKVTDRK